jgi:hypothetical protein
MPPEPLACKGLILSDLVIRDAGTGKISVINCFTAFNAAGFPFQSPPFYLTAQLSGIARHPKPIRFGVSIKKRDVDVYVLNVSGQFNEQGKGDPDEIGEVVWGFPPLIFPQVGVYDLVFSANDLELGTRTIVIKANTMAQVITK